MPTLWAHAFYWAVSDTTVPPLVVGQGGYPAWQASVTAASIVFWPPLEIIRPWWSRLRWRWRAWRLVGRYRSAQECARLDRWLARLLRSDEEQQAVLDCVALALESHAWPVTRVVVRQTATTLGFDRPEAWIPYARVIKADPGSAENTYRHLKSVFDVRDQMRACGSTLTNPALHLIVELGYQGFAVMGR